MSVSPVSAQASTSAVRNADGGEPHFKRVKVAGEVSKTGYDVCQSALNHEIQMLEQGIQRAIAAKEQAETVFRQAQSNYIAQLQPIQLKMTQLMQEKSECESAIEKLTTEQNTKNEELNRLLQQMPHCAGAQEASVKARQVVVLTDRLAAIAHEITAKHALCEEKRATLHAQKELFETIKAHATQTANLEGLKARVIQIQQTIAKMQHGLTVVKTDLAVFQRFFPNNGLQAAGQVQHSERGSPPDLMQSAQLPQASSSRAASQERQGSKRKETEPESDLPRQEGSSPPQLMDETSSSAAAASALLALPGVKSAASASSSSNIGSLAAAAAAASPLRSNGQSPVAAVAQAAMAYQPEVYTSRSASLDNYRLPFYAFQPPQVDQIKEAAGNEHPLFALILDYRKDPAQYYNKIFNLLVGYRNAGTLLPAINMTILGWSPLALVVYQSGCTDLITLFINAGADLKVKVGSYGLMHLSSISMPGKEAFSAAIPILAQRGLDINAGDDFAPIHVACNYRSIAAFKALVELKANVNALDSRNLAPIHYVMADEASPVLWPLLNCDDVNVNIRGGLDLFTPMMIGALFGAYSYNMARLASSRKYGQIVDFKARDRNDFHTHDYAKLNTGVQKQLMKTFIEKRDGGSHPRRKQNFYMTESVNLFRL